MRYNLYINQVKAVEWKLTLSESIIFGYIAESTGWKKKFILSGVLYYWMAKSKVIKDIPLLTDKPDTIYNIYKSLHKKGLIVYKNYQKKDLIALTAKGFSWQNNNSDLNPSEIDTDLNPTYLGSESDKTADNSDYNPTYNESFLLESEGLESENLQPSHSDFLPINSKKDGIKKPSSVPSGESDYSKTNGGGEIKSLQLSSPQPPDVEKISTQMFNLLRKRVPKIEMSEILYSIDIDLPVLSAMFTEYWLFQKMEKFNPDNWKGLVGSFKKWIAVAKNKEIPEKEVKEGLHTNPMMERLIPAIERKKIIKLTPQDANKVNAFIREFSPSDWALQSGTKSFYDGNGKEWDHWMKAVRGAIEREKMGDI